MFYIYGVTGRVPLRSPELPGKVPPAAAVQRSRAADPVGWSDESLPGAQAGGGEGLPRQEAALRNAYGAEATAPHPRAVMRCAELQVPVSCLLSEFVSVAAAWDEMSLRRIDHAWITGAKGQVSGLLLRQDLDAQADFGRFLLPPAPDSASCNAAAQRLGLHCSRSWGEWLKLPLPALMRTPLPALLPGTPLRQAAALLLRSQLPVLPVVNEAGAPVAELGVVQLLAAVAADAPVDLWS